MLFATNSSREYETALRAALSEIKSELKMEKEHNQELLRTVNKLKFYIEHNKGSMEKCESVFRGQLNHIKKREATLKDCLAAAHAAYEAKDAEFKKETERYEIQIKEANELVERVQQEVQLLKSHTRRKWLYFF